MSVAPPKPWERARVPGATGGGGIASALPLGSSSLNAGAAKPWEQPQGAFDSTSSALAHPSTPASRPWDNAGSGPVFARPNQYGGGGALGSSFGGTGYGSSGGYGASGYGNGGSGYNSGLGSGYGNSYGNSYGGTSYGNQYGGMAYGRSGYGSGSMYGGGALSSGYGGMGNSYGGYGGGMNSGMYGNNGMYGGGGGMGMGMGYGQQQGPSGMVGALEGALRPPRAWEVMLRGLHGIMNGFGRLSFLVDENTAAMHFFVSALLTLCDRAGTLYGELARFLLRLLGWNRRKKMLSEQQVMSARGALPHFQPQHQPGSVQLTPGQQTLASAWPSAAHTATALQHQGGRPLLSQGMNNNQYARPNGDGVWDGAWGQN